MTEAIVLGCFLETQGFHYSDFMKDSLVGDILADSISSVEKHFHHSYYSGISGLCWTIDHLIKQNFIDKVIIYIVEAFDEFLCISAISEFQKNNFDFLHGGIGTFMYLLQRSHIPKV